MKFCFYFIIAFLFNSNISSFASTINNSSDSLKNAVTFSQSRLGYNNCSLKYNRNLSSNWWFKLGLVADGEYAKATPKIDDSFWSAARSMSYGIILGFDKNSIPIKGLNFVFGPHIIFSYINEKITTGNPNIPIDQRSIIYHQYNAGIGFTLGFYYNVNDRFAIGSELNPYIAYKRVNDDNTYGTKKHGYEYDIFGNASIISLRYKW